MNRKKYIYNDVITLSEYIVSEDALDRYSCWQDDDTQRGYNYKITETFEEFTERPIKSRFTATIICHCDNSSVGAIFLSPEDTPPDLAIMIYKPYRKLGYGTMAFMLGMKYCFENFALEKIYAGCYLHNIGSMRMLEKCGFIPHPEGNVQEKHFITGENIEQLDFVMYNTKV